MSFMSNLMLGINGKNRDSLNYILILTNLLSLVVFLGNKNLYAKKLDETEITLKKNRKENITEKKKLSTRPRLNNKQDEVVDKKEKSKLSKKQPINNKNELKTKQDAFEETKIAKKNSEVEANVINFEKAKAIKNQDFNKKKQPLKKLVWRFPE